MTTGHAPTLERCVGDVERLKACWGLRPLHRRAASPQGFDDLLALADIDALLSEHGTRRPFFRAVADGGTLPPEQYTVRAQVGSQSVDDLADPDRIAELFAAGATVVLQGLHRAWPPLARFCADLADELGHPTQANAYLSRREARGFNAHWDNHDVFVLQVQGAKRWRVYEPPERWPIARFSADAPALAPDRLVLATEVDLVPGDSLYIPKGTPHEALATDDVSLHLTIGVPSISGQAILEEAVRLAAERDDTFRQPLPIGALTSPEATAAQVERIVKELQAHLQAGVDVAEVAERTARRFTRSRPARNRRALAAVAQADAVALDTVLTLDPTVRTCVEPGGDRCGLALADRNLWFPARVRAVLDWIVSRPAFTVADLPELDDDSKVVLARRLVLATFASAGRG
ncbi:MAG: Cupin 4 family protein [Acidimicrobiales bacterium]|nr:Cupin 4 family protein [Acidimicrobiales bacterium]